MPVVPTTPGSGQVGEPRRRGAGAPALWKTNVRAGVYQRRPSATAALASLGSAVACVECVACACEERRAQTPRYAARTRKRTRKRTRTRTRKHTPTRTHQLQRTPTLWHVKHTHTHTRARTHTHARAHTRAHKRTRIANTAFARSGGASRGLARTSALATGLKWPIMAFARSTIP